MTEEQQKSRLDSLIGIVKAFLRIDPMIALIAILIIIPLSVPIINAILQGNTEITITFVVFISGITMFVYIPLIVVRGYRDKEKTFAKVRSAAIKLESASRMEDKKQARERSDQVVQAKIEVLQAQSKAIIENIPNFERILLHQEADKIRESFGLELTDESQMLTRLGLVIESFELIVKRFDNLESLVPGLQSTMEEIKKQFLEESIPESAFVKDAAQMIEELNAKLIDKELEIEFLKNDHKCCHQLKPDDPALTTPEPHLSLHDELPKREALPTLYNDELEEQGFKSKDDKPTIPEKIKSVLELGKSVILRNKDNEIEEIAIHESSIVVPNAKEELPDAFKEALNVVDNMKDLDPLENIESPEPLVTLNYWACSKCGIKNPLKKVRCRCGSSKRLV